MPADLVTLPLWMLGGLFAVSAALVWQAGTRLVRYVDGVAGKTGLGQAFTGMLLLGGITSLPEVAAVSTASAIGNAPLAINNLLGTASINILLLAVADILYGRDALTRAAAKPATLMQGVLSMVLATVVALFASAGDIAIWGIGVGSGLLGFGGLAALWISSDYEQRHVWEVVEGNGRPVRDKQRPVDHEDWPLARLIVAVAVCALVILVAGFALSLSADAIARTAEIESGLVGFLLVGLVTSLPEISSITAAVRRGRYQMAVGDVFGTNLFNIMLIFLADLIYRGGPVLSEAGRFETIGAVLAVVMTGVFVIGLLERRDRTLMRMGYDSLAGILIFTGGVYLLFRSLG